jgi:hypothetical protein
MGLNPPVGRQAFWQPWFIQKACLLRDLKCCNGVSLAYDVAPIESWMCPFAQRGDWVRRGILSLVVHAHPPLRWVQQQDTQVLENVPGRGRDNVLKAVQSPLHTEVSFHGAAPNSYPFPVSSINCSLQQHGALIKHALYFHTLFQAFWRLLCNGMQHCH